MNGLSGKNAANICRLRYKPVRTVIKIYKEFSASFGNFSKAPITKDGGKP